MTDRATTKRHPRKEPAAPPAVERREVALGWNLRHDTNRAEAVLAESGEVFRKGSRLVRVQESDSGPEIVAASPEFIREVLSANAQWLQNGVPVSPPDEVIAALMARGWWPSVPQIEAVVQFSALRPDGSVLFEPGYDSLARIFYKPNSEFPLLPPLDQEVALEAAARLCQAIEDFSFEAATDRAAFLGALLSIFARPAFEGPAPILLIEGRPGVGKTLMAQVAIAIATGHLPSPPSACGPVSIYDNFEGKISTAWADSQLGSGQLVIVAGENLEIEPGAARRCIRCRLHSSANRPDRTGGFKNPRLLDWVIGERPALIQAALTILVAFIEAGEPDQGLEPWGGFEGWSLVRGAMVWANLEDPALSNEILRNDHDQVDELRIEVFLDGWLEIERAHRRPPSISEGMEIFSLGSGILENFRDTVAELCGKPPGRLPGPKDIRKLFGELRGRVVNGRTLEAVGDSPRGQLWTVKGERN